MIRHSEPCVRTVETFDDMRRRCERLEQTAVRCTLGRVTDLSRFGMRLECDTAPRRDFVVELFAMDRSVSVTGRVVWTNRVGQFRVEAGIEFVDVSPNDARQLELIARLHRVRRCA